MEKVPIEIKITNVYGYFNMFTGTICLAILIFCFIAMGIFTLFNISMLGMVVKMLLEAIPAVINFIIALIVGIGIVEKKKWGWKVGFFSILYWIVFAAYSISYNIAFKHFLKSPLLIAGALVNILLISLVLWAFTRPKVKEQFESN